MGVHRQCLRETHQDIDFGEKCGGQLNGIYLANLPPNGQMGLLES
jgi:hypothetical protein